MQTTKKDKDIMTVVEVAEYLRIRPLTVYKMVKEGKIPNFHLGSAIRFRRSILDQWMEGQEKHEWR